MCGKCSPFAPAERPGLKVRKALAVVEDVLLGHDQDARDLWAILTALRGPDDGDYEMKSRTTVPVRRAAFPRLARNIQRAYHIADFDSSEPLPVVAFSSHFNGHIADAVIALKRVSALSLITRAAK